MDERVEWTWRHGVRFDLPDSQGRGLLAIELLVEWGEARGLTYLGIVTEHHDFGARAEYGATFSGDGYDPDSDPCREWGSRLTGRGRERPFRLIDFCELFDASGWRT